MADQMDPLKLENQLCFPLYACARAVTNAYAPYLEPLGLTYTQYITMMVLWEHRSLQAQEIGDLLHLEPSTITPLVKRLEEKGYVSRTRSQADGRNLRVSITEKGMAAREQALSIPQSMANCVDLEPEKAQFLYSVLYEILDKLSERQHPKG